MRNHVLILVLILTMVIGGLSLTSQEIDRMLGPAEAGVIGIQIIPAGFRVELLGQNYLLENHILASRVVLALAGGKTAWWQALSTVIPWGQQVAQEVRQRWQQAADLARDRWAGLQPW